jgi:hypothetical protein
MLTSILAILAVVAPLLVWLIRRHLTHEDDPATQHAAKREAIAREIIRNDEAAANRSLDDDLDRLRSLQSDRRGQNRPPP